MDAARRLLWGPSLVVLILAFPPLAVEVEVEAEATPAHRGKQWLLRMRGGGLKKPPAEKLDFKSLVRKLSGAPPELETEQVSPKSLDTKPKSSQNAGTPRTSDNETLNARPQTVAGMEEGTEGNAFDNSEMLQQIEMLEKSGLKPEGLDEFLSGELNVTKQRQIYKVDEEDRKNWKYGANYGRRPTVVDYNDMLVLIDPKDTLPYEQYPRNISALIQRNRENGWPVWFSDLYPPSEKFIKTWRHMLMDEWGDMGLVSWNESLSTLLARVEQDGRWGFQSGNESMFWGPKNRSKFWKEAQRNTHIATPENTGAEERWKLYEIEELDRATKESKGKYFDPVRHAQLVAKKYAQELDEERAKRREMRHNTGEDDLTDAELTDREDSEEIRRGVQLVGGFDKDEDDQDEDLREWIATNARAESGFDNFPLVQEETEPEPSDLGEGETIPNPSHKKL
eukprot:CAMPEP_0114487900 /NCGR_PEP_ID=MMETSP0109-20121206/1026_1 /TAXON_ID=29199 /ORGANISM="Chlorarachnion reptans, Strain CCCM449" /LENGTH=451 /DNA_ID=CAMNT_0001664223 /DNA_START=1586 /DNA_END=2938 /DNA_ORIENTATION=+